MLRSIESNIAAKVNQEREQAKEQLKQELNREREQLKQELKQERDQLKQEIKNERGRGTGAQSAPTAAPPPAYSDAEIVGALKGHLTANGMEDYCQQYGKLYFTDEASVRRDTSNPDKYFVTAGDEGSWTFIASLAKVISTSTGAYKVYGC